jgi:hypothetical protein
MSDWFDEELRKLENEFIEEAYDRLFELRDYPRRSRSSGAGFPFDQITRLVNSLQERLLEKQVQRLVDAVLGYLEKHVRP